MTLLRHSELISYTPSCNVHSQLSSRWVNDYWEKTEMTVYYYDLFTGASGGTAGTLLSTTTADSGAAWPTSSSYNVGNAIQLDGTGGIFSSTTGAAIQIPSATQPSTLNFEVQYSFERLSTSTNGTQSGVLLCTESGFSFTDHWEFYYNEGSGFTFAHNDSPVTSYVAGPATGVKWYIKVVVSTSGSNTTFTAYYTATSGGAWTQLCTYTTTTPTSDADVANAGPFFNIGSAGTSSTGPHIGQLVVQDTSATTATLTGPVNGLTSTQSAPFTVTLNHPAGYGGVVITPASAGSGDTFQATSGGGNATTVTIPAGSTTGTFYLTPSTTPASRNVSITTAPSLTLSGTPIAFTAGSAATTLTIASAVTTAPLGSQVPFTLTLNGLPPVGGMTVTLSSSAGSDTFQTLLGGGNVTTISFPYGGAETITFYLTCNGTVGSRSISISSSPVLIYAGSPYGFSATAVGQYLLDTFAGTAGTELSNHPSDSWATWTVGTPANALLDGNGNLYFIGTTTAISSATMPSTQNFQVLFNFKRVTSVASLWVSWVVLSTSPTNLGARWELVYQEGTGWWWGYNDALQGSVVNLAPSAGGSAWSIMIDVSTSGGNTTFASYYSTNSGSTWSQLVSYTTATPTSIPNVAFWVPAQAYSTSLTGVRVGDVIVQVIPPLSSATLSGPTQALFSTVSEFSVSLNEPAGTGEVVITPASSNGSDTFQATPGGANVTTITIPPGSDAGTFWLTPGGSTGSRTISISSGSLRTPGSPLSYNAMTTATGYTVMDVTGGHQCAPVSWTITLTGGDFNGTIKATPGGGTGQCQIYSPSLVPFTGNGTLSKTFTFTPLSVDSVTYTFTNSGGMTNPSPVTYTATGMYFQDTFAASPGTTIQSHSSNALPGIPSGSTWRTPTGGAIEIDGNGMIFLAAEPDSICYSNVTLPPCLQGSSLEIQFDLARKTGGDSAVAGIIFESTTGNTIGVEYHNGDGYCYWIQLDSSGRNVMTSVAAGLSVGATLRLKIDIMVGLGVAGNQYTYIFFSSSPDGGNTWTLLLGSGWPGFITNTSSNPNVWSVGPYFQQSSGSITTGLHIGNIVAQDIPPPTPNCQISKAYIASSGQSAVFFFETFGGAAVTPTALNYLPSFFLNGTSIGIAVNPWVNGTATCAILQFQNNTQVNEGDVVTVSAPASWMTCGTGNAANQVIHFPLTNCTGNSAYRSGSTNNDASDTFVRTLAPGFNISFYGTSSLQSIPANLRYRLPGMQYSNMTVDGYPTGMWSNPGQLDFYDWDSIGSQIDSTGTPGVPGYYAIGYDDNSYATNPTTLTLYSPNTAESTVTQIHSCDNPGTNGIGQFYLFQVLPVSGSTSANVPVGLQLSNTSKAPNVSNVFILYGGTVSGDPNGDFTFTLGQPLTFSRANPYAIANIFKNSMPNGCGVLRFMDSYLNFSGLSNASEIWEMHQLADFSWNNSNRGPTGLNVTVGLSEIRGLYASNSPYLYGDPSTLPHRGQSWTPETSSSVAVTLGASMNTTQTTLTLSAVPQTVDAPFYGLLLTIDSENMRVRGVDSTGLIITVERGSSSATAGVSGSSHSAGASITIASRVSWSSGGSNPLSTFGGADCSAVEILTQGANYPHYLKAGQAYTLNGTYPSMTFSDSSTWTLGVYQNAMYWPTGADSFAVLFTSNSSAAATLSSGTTYTLTPSTNTLTLSEPDVGFPYEFQGMTTSAFTHCNLHCCLPMLASDSYVYAAATKILNNTIPGRKVYVELTDEPWNTVLINLTLTFLSRVNGGGDPYQWYVQRLCQIRTIFRTVFGSRAGEVNGLINVRDSGGAGIGSDMLGYAQAVGIPIDAYAVAPYLSPGNDAAPSGTVADIAAWNGSASIAQMADLCIHEWMYDPTSVGGTNDLAAHNSAIASYNTATGNNCQLIGYEGGYAAGAPNDCTSSLIPGMSAYGYGNVVPCWNHDIEFDPVWRIYEKDYYAWLQNNGFTGFATYSHSLYYFYQSCWGAYKYVGMPYGKGDGSDGKANNRHCLCSPGFTYSKSANTCQTANVVSVRGQAHVEWMGGIGLTTASLSGPTFGGLDSQSTAFTVTVNQPASTGGVTVTPASSGGADTFQATSGGSSASSITIPAGSTSVTFYLTPGGTAGNRSISITTSPSLSYSGSPITYSAAAVPTAATLSGPTSGIVGVQSTAFTVTLDQPASTGGVTVAPASTNGSDTFQAM